MADWPVQQTVQGTYTSNATSFTAIEYTTANIKGGWLEIMAATPFACSGLHVSLASHLAHGRYLTDLAIGAAGSEIVIIENVYSWQRDWVQGQGYYFPISIPAGVRLSARAQGTPANGASRPVIVGERAGSNTIPMVAQTATIGAVTADSAGTSIDPGATGDTKGAWVELSSSCPFDAKGFCFAIGDQGITRQAAVYYWRLDIGVGAAGSEHVVFGDWSFNCYSSASELHPNVSRVSYCPIPKGERISARALCNQAHATGRLFDVIVYLFG